MKKYRIENMQGSGSGCDEIFNTEFEAMQHMKNYTDRERQGLEIISVETNYALCFCVDGRYQYAADIDQYLNGETVTNLDEASAWIEDEAEANAALEEAQGYIDEHELSGLSVTLEEWEVA